MNNMSEQFEEANATIEALKETIAILQSMLAESVPAQRLQYALAQRDNLNKELDAIRDKW
jgi:SMC interacting uncharacterized protein involved in chromosome segregation